jgi:signal transduction histidine kinase
MQSKSVLVVEDDGDIRETLSGVLTSEGYAVTSCANGREALDRLRSGTRADVILLDLMMPVMNGWQFRVLQKGDPQIAAIPVLALSANDTPQAAAIDAEAYLRKPVDYDRLLGAIERALLSFERQRLQATIAETERLTSLGTLAAGVAHEINNPLAYVAANVDFVARRFERGEIDGPEREVAHGAMMEALEGCHRIRQIVKDVAVFSRANEDAREPVDVRAVLESAANMVQHEVRARAVVVRDYADVPPVMASEGRLAQVFLNLIVNAAQALDGGKTPVRQVRLVVRQEDGWVVVEVHDTGAGIPPEVRSRLFDPFFTTKPIGVGTGLGLSIARGIVLSHGGDISVESEVGRGTIFRVRLPPVGAEPKKGTTSGTHPIAAPTPRARVLVIDDEELIGRTLQRLLGGIHEVTATTRARDALHKIEEGERFDLVLCDLMMPEMDGIDVHAAIERLAPEQAARMLFVTGGATTDRARTFLASRPDRIVEKPFTFDALEARIEEAVLGRGRNENGG